MKLSALALSIWIRLNYVVWLRNKRFHLWPWEENLIRDVTGVYISIDKSVPGNGTTVTNLITIRNVSAAGTLSLVLILFDALCCQQLWKTNSDLP